MNHHQPGSLANYNSLTDKHLAGYFSNTRIRRHLLRSGLISRSGRIIPEKEYQLNSMKKDHQKYIRECLAQAIFHKVLDMERHHQVEIKRKLENSARRERVQRIKVERSRKATEETYHQLSPHPSTAPRNRFGRRKLGNRGQSVHLATCPRPNTAPGNIQHPVRLQPLFGNITTESASKATLSSRTKFLTLEKEHQFPCAGDRGAPKPMLSMDYSSGISPYRFPIINNYVIPIPPPPKSEKNISTVKGVTSRGRRLRPTTAPNGLEQLLIRDSGRFYRPQVQSNACVTMIYLGKTVHLSYDLLDYREEVKIYQQHCGGENLCVFRGKLLEGETFQFISRRHYGFPFSLTFYLNGIQVDRLSSCCEYKHRKGTRLGGKHGYFGFVNVERSAPCYRCIIAMGLDKRPSPPKKKVADEDEAKKEDSEKDKGKEEGRSECGSSKKDNKDSHSRFSSAAEEEKEHVEGTEEMEWESRKGDAHETSHGSEKDQRSGAYDEDFEADEEKSDEKVNEEGQADDQMNGMSKSPSDDEKDNLDHERKNKNSSQKALRASDSEQDESDGYVESDSEGEDKQDKNLAPSPSSSSTPYLSENISDSETRRQDGEQDNMDIHSEYESETKSQREDSQETEMEEEEDNNRTEHTTAKRTPDVSYRRKMEANLQDMSSLSEKLSLVGSLDVDVREEETEEDVLLHFRGSIPAAEPRSEMTSEDEEEGESKPAKEKIAEAIEHDQLLSSEPEPSDSSTEDEEEDTVATGDKEEVTDGASLAKKSRAPGSQTVVEQVEQERQMVGKERALEEVEILEEGGPKDTALEDESLAKNVVALTAQNAGKDQLVREETELEKEVESDEDHVEEEEEMYEKLKSSEGELKGEGKVKEPKEMLSEHEISDGEELSGGYQLEAEEVEDQSVSGDLIAVEEASDRQDGGKEVTEASEMLGTVESVGKKVKENEVQETKETIQEAFQADEALETASVEDREKNMEETKPKRNGTWPDHKPGTEGVVKGKLTDSEGVSATFLKEEEHMKEREDTEINLGEASTLETEFIAPDSKVKERISIDEKDVALEKLVDEDDFIQEVPFDLEASIQEGPCMLEGDSEKIPSEMSKMKTTSTEDVSAAEVLKPWAGEQSLDHHDNEMVILTEEEDTRKDQGAIVNGQEEEMAYKVHSEVEEPTLTTMSETKGTAQQEENVVKAVEEETKQEERVEMLMSGMTVPEKKQRTEKEFFADVVPEALPFATEESIRKAEAKRKEMVKGEADAEEAERKVMIKDKVKAEETKRKLAIEGDEEDEETQRLLTVKWKMKDEDSESEGEIVSLVTESEGEPTSEMTIMRWQNIVNLEEDIVAEAKDVPESSAQKVRLTGGLNKESGIENEPDVQDKPGETTEETEQTSVYMKVQDEEVTEDEGSDTEEQVTGEGITLADVEEALLIGIQQFITEVSRLNEEVEDKEEDSPVEDLAEEMSNQKDLDRQDFFSAAMAEEEWQNESKKVDERGIGELVDRNSLEENNGSGKKKTRQEESPEENRAVTEVIQWSTEQSEGGQP